MSTQASHRRTSISGENALRFSGRLSVTYAIPSRFSTRRCAEGSFGLSSRYPFVASHARMRCAHGVVVGLAGRRALDRLGDHHVARHLVAGEACSRTCALIASASGDVPATSAATTCPRRGSGTPTTTASCTPGQVLIASSTSSGKHLLAAGVDADRSAPEKRDGAIRFDRRVVAGHRAAHAVDHGERGLRLLRILVVAQRHDAAHRDASDRCRCRARSACRRRR